MQIVPLRKGGSNGPQVAFLPKNPTLRVGDRRVVSDTLTGRWPNTLGVAKKVTLTKSVTCSLATDCRVPFGCDGGDPLFALNCRLGIRLILN